VVRDRARTTRIAGAEDALELVGGRDLQLIVAAVVRTLVGAPAHEVRGVPEARALHVVVRNLHDERRLLRRWHAQVPLREADTVVCLGDYVHRGEDSAATVAAVSDFAREHRACVFLRTNYEDDWLEQSDGVRLQHLRMMVDSLEGLRQEYCEHDSTWVVGAANRSSLDEGQQTGLRRVEVAAYAYAGRRSHAAFGSAFAGPSSASSGVTAVSSATV